MDGIPPLWTGYIATDIQPQQKSHTCYVTLDISENIQGNWTGIQYVHILRYVLYRQLRAQQYID